jgi:hypothetical protein
VVGVCGVLGRGNRLLTGHLHVKHTGTATAGSRSEPDKYYEWDKEKHAAEFLRRVLGIHLRSVWTDHGTTRRPDSVWDEERLTVELKTPESERPSRWGELVADGADKADVVVFDSRAVRVESRDQLLIILTRAMRAHQRGDRVDHVLLIGHTEQTDWFYWAKGGPRWTNYPR